MYDGISGAIANDSSVEDEMNVDVTVEALCKNGASMATNVAQRHESARRLKCRPEEAAFCEMRRVQESAIAGI